MTAETPRTMTVQELLDLVRAALVGQGLSDTDAAAAADDFVSAEVAGVLTHGISKLVSMKFGRPNALPEEKSFGSMVVVDAKGANGIVLFRRLAERSVDLVAQNGCALIFARNFSRYNSLYPYTEAVSRHGFISFLMNNAGPSAVAPFGSIDPITGTNPICFSFPTQNGTQTFDFPTSELPWGAIRRAAIEDQDLPERSFLDVHGEFTRDPSLANAVPAFGFAKGSALNLAIELICGAASGASVGGQVDSEFDLGALFLSFDPERTGGTNFPSVASALFDEIRSSRPRDQAKEVRVPGDRLRGRSLLQTVGPEQLVPVPELTFTLLERMSRGEAPEDLASNPRFN